MSDLEIVYFTEKGVDLHKIFPEVAELQLAMNAGWRWSDVEQYNPTQFTIPRKPTRVVYTTEAEKKRLLDMQAPTMIQEEPQEAPIQEETQEETKPTPETNTATVEAYVANILADLQKQPQENRTLEDIADYIASAIYKTPENLHSEILDGVACTATALIQEPVVTLQEESMQDNVVQKETSEESGYFTRLYNRAYNYLSSWIY